jgi:tryptophan halogenase
MNTSERLRVVIVGGGAAGWMTAAALAKVLQGRYSITLVESDDIGIIGVGEATIPMISLFNRLLGLDENEFLKQTQGTFKLGIEFVNWARLGDRYMHGFGVVGQENATVDFHQYWLKQSLAAKAKSLDHYSINNAACLKNKFLRPRLDMPNSPLSQIAYAFHFDASLYAKYLRTFSEALGVKRVEGKIIDVAMREGDGHVTALTLASGQHIEGELFIDCSGFSALLTEGALKTGFEDWSQWLLCNRAIAVPCAPTEDITPYTRSTARQAGWQWRIPLQHRIGNGHVFCSHYISEDEATAVLMGNLDGAPLAEPRTIRYVTGRRKKAWNKNVVSIGLACGFVEPLESTAIHLVQMSIAHLLTMFPSAGFEEADRDQYNRMMQQEYEWVRDFIILHYKATERNDSPFWNHCREMEVPQSLTDRMELFKTHGRIYREGNELFSKMSWLQVLHGQRVRPRGHHPLTDLRSDEEIQQYLDEVEGVIQACVEAMPSHAQFVADNCATMPRM